MGAYWWQCLNCKASFSFNEVTGSRGVVHFIWDELLKNLWDQKLLIKTCGKSKEKKLVIAYEIPRKEPELIFVNHIIGFTRDNYFLQMFWETISESNLKSQTKWYDFKYLNNRNILGLSRSCVFTEKDLKEIFEIFNQKCHKLF